MRQCTRQRTAIHHEAWVLMPVLLVHAVVKMGLSRATAPPSWLKPELHDTVDGTIDLTHDDGGDDMETDLPKPPPAMNTTFDPFPKVRSCHIREKVLKFADGQSVAADVKAALSWEGAVWQTDDCANHFGVKDLEAAVQDGFSVTVDVVELLLRVTVEQANGMQQVMGLVLHRATQPLVKGYEPAGQWKERAMKELREGAPHKLLVLEEDGVWMVAHYSSQEERATIYHPGDTGDVPACKRALDGLGVVVVQVCHTRQMVDERTSLAHLLHNGIILLEGSTPLSAPAQQGSTMASADEAALNMLSATAKWVVTTMVGTKMRVVFVQGGASPPPAGLLPWLEVVDVGEDVKLLVEQHTGQCPFCTIPKVSDLEAHLCHTCQGSPPLRMADGRRLLPLSSQVALCQLSARVLERVVAERLQSPGGLAHLKAAVQQQLGKLDAAVRGYPVTTASLTADEVLERMDTEELHRSGFMVVRNPNPAHTTPEVLEFLASDKDVLTGKLDQQRWNVTASAALLDGAAVTGHSIPPCRFWQAIRQQRGCLTRIQEAFMEKLREEGEPLWEGHTSSWEEDLRAALLEALLLEEWPVPWVSLYAPEVSLGTFNDPVGARQAPNACTRVPTLMPGVSMESIAPGNAGRGVRCHGVDTTHAVPM